MSTRVAMTMVVHGERVPLAQQLCNQTLRMFSTLQTDQPPPASRSHCPAIYGLALKRLMARASIGTLLGMSIINAQ